MHRPRSYFTRNIDYRDSDTSGRQKMQIVYVFVDMFYRFPINRPITEFSMHTFKLIHI